MITSQDHHVSIHLDSVKKMEIFLGKWSIEGKNFPVPPTNVESQVSGEDNYTWLKGNFFIIDNWQHLTKAGNHIGITLLGYDAERKEYFSRNFDNLGFERRYVMEQEGYQWSFTGPNERAVRKFDTQGNSYEEHWEVLTGNMWIPLCTMQGSKINQ